MNQESQSFSLSPLRPISILRPLGYISHILSLISNFSAILCIFTDFRTSQIISFKQHLRHFYDSGPLRHIFYGLAQAFYPFLSLLQAIFSFGALLSNALAHFYPLLFILFRNRACNGFWLFLAISITLLTFFRRSFVRLIKALFSRSLSLPRIIQNFQF